MTEEMGPWVRKTEGRCIRRDCSITTGLNAEGYCKRCWGRKIREAAEAEEAKKTEEWLRKQAEEKAKKQVPQSPPTIEERVVAIEERLTKLENILGYGEKMMGLQR